MSVVPKSREEFALPSHLGGPQGLVSESHENGGSFWEEAARLGEVRAFSRIKVREKQRAPSPGSADRHRPQAFRCRSPPVSVCGLSSKSFVHQLSVSSLSCFSLVVSASPDCDIFIENISCFGPNSVSEKELRTLNISFFTFQTLLLTRLSVKY